ncbi:transcriptional repressor LexA [Myxococcota bacterium]|nr:transcriptional repressor LexA [Myxococcota bacterium]MCZ7620116.1 transcriptional repressor LexA [Myxococcota bacterium]
MALTRRQREIYDFVCAFIDEHGYSPSLEEIGAQFHLSSVATVHKHVTQLVEKGWLRKSWNRARSLEPAGDAAAGEILLPLLGVVAAGAPIEPIEVEERIAIPADLVRRPAACFALRVRGDSMIDEQIREGDTVIVERRSEVRDGDTVVAVLRGEEATLKRFRRRGATVHLVPANARMKTIEVPARDVEIRGVVRALLRRY